MIALSPVKIANAIFTAPSGGVRCTPVLVSSPEKSSKKIFLPPKGGRPASQAAHCLIPRKNRWAIFTAPKGGRARAFPLRVNAHARFHCLIPPLKPLRDFNCPQRGRPSLNIVLSLKPIFNIVLTLRGAYRNLSLFTIHYPLPRSG